MTNLSDKFDGLETQLTSESAAQLAATADTNDTLSAINVALEIMGQNIAANTKMILAAISANGACGPCAASPLIGTPPISTTSPIDADKCRRVQGLLHTIGQFIGYADAAGAVSAIFTPAYVTTAVGEVRTADSDSGIPVPAWVDTLLIAADGVNYIINKAILGGNASSEFAGILGELQAALFDASTPAAAKSAYDSAIAAASVSAWSKPLMTVLGYSDLFNYYLDTANTPNVAGYDGSACGLPAGCLTFTTAEVVLVTTESGSAIIPDWAGKYGLSVRDNPGHSNPVWVDNVGADNWNGWSWTITSNAAAVYHQDLSDPATGGTGLTGTFAGGSGLRITFVSTDVFALTFCPPSPS